MSLNHCIVQVFSTMIFFLHFFSNLIIIIKTLNVCLRLFCVICETILALMHNNVAPKSLSTALQWQLLAIYFQRKKAKTSEGAKKKKCFKPLSSGPFECDKKLRGLLLMEPRNIIKSLSGNEGRSSFR